MSGYFSDIIQRYTLPASSQAPVPVLTPNVSLPGISWRPLDSESTLVEATEPWNEAVLYSPTQPAIPQPDSRLLPNEHRSPSSQLQPRTPLYIERHLIRTHAGDLAPSHRQIEAQIHAAEPGESPTSIQHQVVDKKNTLMPANTEALHSIQPEQEKPHPLTKNTGKNKAGNPPGKPVEMFRPVADPPAVTILQPAVTAVPPVVPGKQALATPKLIIGKLTVEVIHPAPKVQTVQPSANRQPAAPEPKPFTPYNKLTFGLGQM